jgi:hypothetical protein
MVSEDLNDLKDQRIFNPVNSDVVFALGSLYWGNAQMRSHFL